VTDANLVLGRLDAELALAGSVHLDEARTRRHMDKAKGKIASLEQFASGIVQVAETEMEKAIRLISVERGYNPRDFTLVAFGGAGPLHACSLARALGIPRVLVPVMPGALSALGILAADVVRDYSRTVMIPVASQSNALTRRSKASANERFASLENAFAELEKAGMSELKRERLQGNSVRSVDLRYAGQGYEINVPAGPEMLRHFHEAHRKRYGHADETRPIEIVNVRLRTIAASPPLNFPRRPRGEANSSHAVLKNKNVRFGNEWLKTPVLDREQLAPGNIFEGPAIVHEYSATTFVPPGCKAEVDEYSNLVITVEK
jgi:N-methylhydantoinase A